VSTDLFLPDAYSLLIDLKKMNSTKSNLIRNSRRSGLRQNPVAIINNQVSIEEERKYEMLGVLRKRLGKSKEEFNRILEFYKHLLENRTL
jgi:hypothetical protein